MQWRSQNVRAKPCLRSCDFPELLGKTIQGLYKALYDLHEVGAGFTKAVGCGMSELGALGVRILGTSSMRGVWGADTCPRIHIQNDTAASRKEPKSGLLHQVFRVGCRDSYLRSRLSLVSCPLLWSPESGLGSDVAYSLLYLYRKLPNIPDQTRRPD